MQSSPGMGKGNQGMSHKLKKNNRLAQRKRLLKDKADQALIHKARQVLGEAVQFRDAPDGVKMSDMLEAFVEPYRNDIDSKESYAGLLRIGMVAWNAALIPPAEREAGLGALLATLPDTFRAEATAMITELVARKDREFSQCRRAIVDFVLEDNGEEWHLSVASTV